MPKKLLGNNSPVSMSVRVDDRALKDLDKRFQALPRTKFIAAEMTAVKVSLRSGKDKSGQIIVENMNVAKKVVKRKIFTKHKRVKSGNTATVIGILRTEGSPQEGQSVLSNGRRKANVGRIALGQLKGTREIGGRRKNSKPGEPTPDYGISYKVGKNFPRTRILEKADKLPTPPFVVRLKAGGNGAFRRLTSSGREQAVTNLIQLYGPSVTLAALKSTKWNTYIREELPKTLLKNFNRQLTFQLSKLNRELNRKHR